VDIVVGWVVGIVPMTHHTKETTLRLCRVGKCYLKKLLNTYIDEEKVF